MGLSRLPEYVEGYARAGALGKCGRVLVERGDGFDFNVLLRSEHADHKVDLRQFHPQSHRLEFVGADFAELASAFVKQSRNRVSVTHAVSIARCCDEVIRALGVLAT